jgi:hypothetical protein
MKTKTRNFTVCALMAAVLLAMAMLVTSCPAEPESLAQGYKPPAGMGAIQLSFNKAIQRTLLPDDVDFDDLLAFDLDILPDPDPEDPWETVKIDRESGGAITFGPIDVAPNTYTVNVIAYLDKERTKPVAAATEEDIEIDEGAAPTITLTLKALDPATATGQGTFKWVINVDALAVAPAYTVTAGTITFTGIGGTGTDASVDILAVPSTPAWSSNKALDAGYYYVDFALTVKDDEDNSISVTFRHILHIYQHMESEFTYTLSKDLFFRVISTVSTTMGIIIDDIDPIANIPLVLTAGGTPIAAEATYATELSIDEEDEVIIAIDNASSYDTFEWYSDDPTDSLAATASYTVVAGEAPFDAPGLHQLTVVAIKGGVPYYSYIFIKIVN